MKPGFRDLMLVCALAAVALPARGQAVKELCCVVLPGTARPAAAGLGAPLLDATNPYGQLYVSSKPPAALPFGTQGAGLPRMPMSLAPSTTAMPERAMTFTGTVPTAGGGTLTGWISVGATP